MTQLRTSIDHERQDMLHDHGGNQDADDSNEKVRTGGTGLRGMLREVQGGGASTRVQRASR